MREAHTVCRLWVQLGDKAPWSKSHGAVNEPEQRLARHVDALLVFPVAGREVRRPGVLPPKAEPELLEAFTVRGRGVELCAGLARQHRDRARLQRNVPLEQQAQGE
jgi:hypothetical protein